MLPLLELDEPALELAQERRGLRPVVGALLDAAQAEVGLRARYGYVEQAPLLEEVAPLELGPRGGLSAREEPRVDELHAPSADGEAVLGEPADEDGLELEALGGVDGEKPDRALSRGGGRSPGVRVLVGHLAGPEEAFDARLFTDPHVGASGAQQRGGVLERPGRLGVLLVALEELADARQSLPERVELLEEARLRCGLVYGRDRLPGPLHLLFRDAGGGVAGAQEAEDGALGGLGGCSYGAGRGGREADEGRGEGGDGGYGTGVFAGFARGLEQQSEVAGCRALRGRGDVHGYPAGGQGVHKGPGVEEAAPEDGDLVEGDAAGAVELDYAVGDPGPLLARARGDLVDDRSGAHRGRPLLLAPGPALVA